MIRKMNIVLAALLVSITLVNCSKNNAISQPPEVVPPTVVPPETEDFFVLSGTVTDTMSNQPIVSAVVSANNITTVTDSSGNFSFDSLLAGIYHLSVAHIEYNTTTITVDLQADFNINIKLNRKLFDYLPLYQGKSWTYIKYYGCDYYEEYGQASWKVINVSVEDTITTYETQETFNGIRIEAFTNDTINISNAIRNIYILETENHKFHLQDFGDNTAWFDRYYPISSPDTINYSVDYGINVVLKKETGMVYIWAWHTGNSTVYGETYTLLE